MRSKLFSVTALLILASLILSACAAETIVVTEIVEGEVVEKIVTATPAPVEDLVTLDINYGTDIAGLDPQRAEDVTSINAIESLFVGLTDYDDATGAWATKGVPIGNARQRPPEATILFLVGREQRMYLCPGPT